MIVFGSCSDYKFNSFDSFVSEFIFGKHSSKHGSQQSFRIFFHHKLSSNLLEIPLISAVCIHEILLKFFSCHFDFVDVFYKNKIPCIPEIRIICLVFSQEQFRNIYSQSSEHFPARINSPPCSIFLHVSWLYSKRLIQIFFCKFHDYYFK